MAFFPSGRQESTIPLLTKIQKSKRYVIPQVRAKEVATGYECGVGIDEWQDIKVGDQFEVFEFVEVARKLSDTISETKPAEVSE